MTSCTLICPHQLFAEHPGLSSGRQVILVEGELFFGSAALHPFKRLLHRASMKAYAEALQGRGFQVEYVDYARSGSTADLFASLAARGYREIHCCDPADYLLERRMRRYAARHDLRLYWYPSPGFLLSREAVREALEAGGYPRMAAFYQQQRKRFDLLLDGSGKPLGGSWSFDRENRKRMPAGLEPPLPWIPSPNRYVQEAAKYVANQWPDNGPSTYKDFIYPVTREDARKVLLDFCENRLDDFGAYQDALDASRPFLFHSLLSPSLNNGLLLPEEALQAVMDRHRDRPVPLPALEGFVRQLIGWREFVRGVYEREGTAMRTHNFWGFEEELPAAFLKGKTGLPPLDDVIRKVERFGYAHHIERLMVIGNFLLLCECHPDAVYQWFMDRFVDAYDWVMVPNVYGMSQYAYGGGMTTKPYLSGSNYLLKQSHYRRGDWCDDWDALFWRFIRKHRDVFLANPRMQMMARLEERRKPAQRKTQQLRAEAVLERLRSG